MEMLNNMSPSTKPQGTLLTTNWNSKHWFYYSSTVVVESIWNAFNKLFFQSILPQIQRESFWGQCQKPSWWLGIPCFPPACSTCHLMTAGNQAGQVWTSYSWLLSCMWGWIPKGQASQSLQGLIGSKILQVLLSFFLKIDVVLAIFGCKGFPW